MEQGQSIDEQRAQDVAVGGEEAADLDLPLTIEVALERRGEVRFGQGAQLVEDAAHLDALVGGEVAPGLGLDQDAVGYLTELANLGIVVVDLAQDDAHGVGEVAQQRQCLDVVGRHWDPDARYADNQVELLAVDPAVPTGHGPLDFRVDGGVGDLALLSIRLMPYPAYGPQRRAIDSRGAPGDRPHDEGLHQIAPQATALPGQSRGDSLQLPVEGAPSRVAFVLGQQTAQAPHLRVSSLRAARRLRTLDNGRTIMISITFRKSRSG